jgi:hypothetical protein
VRPRYERPADLTVERKVAAQLERKGIKLHKLPVSYRLDFAMFKNGKLKGWAEIKARRNNHDRYPTLLISLGKVMAARQLADVSGTRSILLVQYLDGLYWCDFASAFEIRMGGRYDRGDADDVEPVAHFPMEAFTIV